MPEMDIFLLQRVSKELETQNIKMICRPLIRIVAATHAKTTVFPYIKHLDRCNEILAARLMTIHNVYFYQNLMSQLRTAIINSSLDELINQLENDYEEVKND